VLGVFFVSTFKIPTHSMAPALLSGDAVVLNKLFQGPRMFRNFDFLETNERPPYYRLPAWRPIKRNDVLVFNFPYAQGLVPRMGNVYCVKGCVALPGDSLYVKIY
jgi:signal peptidase I